MCFIVVFLFLIDDCKFVSKNRIMKNENVYFRCTNHNCKNIKQIILVKNEHNHQFISNRNNIFITNCQKITLKMIIFLDGYEPTFTWCLLDTLIG